MVCRICPRPGLPPVPSLALEAVGKRNQSHGWIPSPSKFPCGWRTWCQQLPSTGRNEAANGAPESRERINITAKQSARSRKGLDSLSQEENATVCRIWRILGGLVGSARMLMAGVKSTDLRAHANQVQSNNVAWVLGFWLGNLLGPSPGWTTQARPRCADAQACQVISTGSKKGAEKFGGGVASAHIASEPCFQSRLRSTISMLRVSTPMMRSARSWRHEMQRRVVMALTT
ncbi:hypothetical protein B0T16DRAFT_168249 [Cercophora newfieldiana]|uniref:Uncharacterized protein n=1 Tax=Cercophora newfieldiana TaxID=92897 RepID=A0AA39Y613_9PEZI|nr:hypothetical protein B0T16DRAFT_168249 [Cercophora newfieldiana]